ncbi:hypothetical protein [Methanopyrus kandleri]|uniref:Uncharacterized protein n=1 Tax=Methanopyrus kandleri TaxID=2320 RepID=A0A832TD67_9EURY|nr:hypothetical protein [Methanopyrus kandleri]HII70673.1 hypothetical protein [Methanopyrus kandleri]
MEEAFDVLAKYARKEELEELPDDVAAVIKQMQGIVHTGGRYEVVTEEGEDGTVEVVVYTLRRSRRLGTSKYPGWERTKKLAELKLDEEAQERVQELYERVSQRLA